MTTSIDRAALDRVVGDLREHAGSWAAVPLAERIPLLERMLPEVATGAAEMARPARAPKGWRPARPGPPRTGSAAPGRWPRTSRPTCTCCGASRPTTTRSGPAWCTNAADGPTPMSCPLPGGTPCCSAASLPGSGRVRALRQSKRVPAPAAGTGKGPGTPPSPWCSARETSPRSPRSTSCASCMLAVAFLTSTAATEQDPPPSRTTRSR